MIFIFQDVFYCHVCHYSWWCSSVRSAEAVTVHQSKLHIVMQETCSETLKKVEKVASRKSRTNHMYSRKKWTAQSSFALQGTLELYWTRNNFSFLFFFLFIFSAKISDLLSLGMTSFLKASSLSGITYIHSPFDVRLRYDISEMRSVIYDRRFWTLNSKCGRNVFLRCFKVACITL